MNKAQQELARETIKLFREAEAHRVEHRCNSMCEVWFNLQYEACRKAERFEFIDNLTNGSNVV